MDELSNHTNKRANNSRHCDNFEEDIFDDSIFLENLENFDVKETANGNTCNKGDAKTDLNISALCCDEELNGYDKLTGQTWIYPINYPMRDYQFNIIKAAMLKNCLVSLPTGLGKTFIAAVVMYNFYRWYPLGKIIFTAPTRPLVAQQIEACYNIVAMPQQATVEMTGQMPVNTRKVHWQSKRVFFATPQVIYNDIKSGMCPGDKIKCLVFDEGHKARGNYAYGNIISTLSEMGHTIYRVLALSATPGNKVEDVIHVVKRLHISHLELRTENCLDVRVYSHARKINTVVIELGPELSRLRQQYVEILEGYNRKLKNFNVVQNLGNLSKGRIVMLYKEFKNRERGARHPQHNYIMRTFTLLITLYHGLELLVKHGARVFLNFFDEHPEKTWVQFDKDLTSFFDKLRDQLGVDPLSFDRSILPDGTVPEIPSNLNFGHPKFDKLKEIMLEHFNIAKQKGQVTKAIVFCEYRESVNLVHCLLLQCRPTIVPEMFVGQGSGKDGKTGVSQKQQLRVMREFLGGAVNTLVCTCVAEEGLDVGAVDLILCFDVSTRSPVRLVQRCGRTGRERSGQVFILVTEGREHTTLLDCMRQSDGLNNRILRSEEVKKNLYKSNPRMVPRDFVPECQQMYITVNKEISEKNKKTKDKAKDKSKGKLQKGQQDLVSMFQKKASSSKIPKTDDKNNEWVTKEEFDKVFPKGYRECNYFPQPDENWTMSKESLSRENQAEPLVTLPSSLKSQRDVQDTYSIGHSSDALLLTELLQQKQEVPTFKSPVKKDGDIRVLFSKTTKSIKDYTKSMKELGINNNLNISTEVLNLLVDLSLENTATVKPCYICLNVCKCPKFCKSANKTNLPVGLCSRSQPVLPDIDLIDNINAGLLILLANNKENNKIDCNKNNNLSESKTSLEYRNQSKDHNISEEDCLFEDNDMFDNIEVSPTESRPELQSRTHSIKRFDDSRKSGLNTENEKEIIKSDVTCDNDNIFEDNDCFEDIDIPVEVTSAPRIPMGPSNDLYISKRIDESITKDGSTGNSNINANIELDDDTIIIDSQEICENNNIFEDNDLFEGDMPAKLTSAHRPQMNHTDVHTMKRIDETVKEVKTENKDELENDTIIIDSQEICENNNFEDNVVFKGTKMLNDNNIVIVDDYDIFEDDDSFEDIKIRDNVTPTKSKLPSCLHDVLHVAEKTPKSTTQLIEEENDINTVNVLKYFHLNSISDIFQDSDLEGFTEESVDTIKGKKLSLLPQTGPNNNEKCKDNNLNTVIKVESPLSPSLLSNRSSSPILGSQKRKINLSLNKPKKELNKLSLSDNKRPISVEEKTSTSPLTEPDHRKTMKSLHQVTEEIIVLDSDDEIFEDDSKDFTPPKETHTTIKRKFHEEPDRRCDSPYFRKKLKLNENSSKPSTIKEKIIAALASHQNPDSSFQNDKQINFMTTKSPTFKLKKENRDPLISDAIDKEYPKSKMDMLEVFKHRSKSKSKANERATNVPRKITYIDDDDFETESPHRKRVLKLKNERTTNDKKVNEFLDVEAALTDDDSDDERSDDSAGSLVHFICDDTRGEDIHGIYLQSVKSPVKGVFKVPQLPPLKKDEVLSQYVEPDTYEMDSFCVDSHTTINETTEISELEIAEMILKERRKEKKNKNRSNTQKDAEGSPIIRKKYRNIKRQIDSDSEDSS